MAIKKSQIYASLWSACDDLRGGIEPASYKDYVLVILFVKYISDKYKNNPYSPIQVPKGSTFDDLIKLKGKPNIGLLINQKILKPISTKNQLKNFPDFNDSQKLGSGKEMVDRLSKLIGNFEDPDLDFSKNKAIGDDILGDAYEYLMRNFASESGKKKGAFYTPSEVSRVMSSILGIDEEPKNKNLTIHDPTCGSGSLLLRVGDAATCNVSLFGQELDMATANLAQMNMILHNHPTAEILEGNVLSNPKFQSNNSLKEFDYVISNPPFSDKRWSNGINPERDNFSRFEKGIPPKKQGDYAYLLHVTKCLKNNGKAAVILPHGVLFRGKAEEQIRKEYIKDNIIEAIISLPKNLFFGTGIPACIVVLNKSRKDKEKKQNIFMINASELYEKDGAKNRLREMDIKKIVDVYRSKLEIDNFSTSVSLEDIKKQNYTLNLPRYLKDTQIRKNHNLKSHVYGGIPSEDISRLNKYWDVFPTLKKELFEVVDNKKIYLKPKIEEISIILNENSHFEKFKQEQTKIFQLWFNKNSDKFKTFKKGINPILLLNNLSENLLKIFKSSKLVDPYLVYQSYMTYWNETMADDLYMISIDGWKLEVTKKIKLDKKGNKIVDHWECNLLPKKILSKLFYKKDLEIIEEQFKKIDRLEKELESFENENLENDSIFSDLEKINKTNVLLKIKELKTDKDFIEDIKLLKNWLNSFNQISDFKKDLKNKEKLIDTGTLKICENLKEDEIKNIVINKKWFNELKTSIQNNDEEILLILENQIKEIFYKYKTTFNNLNDDNKEYEKKILENLEKLLNENLAGKIEGEVVTLGDIATFAKGKYLSKSDLVQNGKYKCIHYGELFTKYNSRIHNIVSRTNIDDNVMFSNGNEVLMPTSDVTPDGLAKASFLEQKGVIIGGDILIIRPNKNELFGGYLSEQIRFLEDQILSLVSGTTVYHIYAQDMSKFKFWKPTKIDDQIKISKMLELYQQKLNLLEAKKNKIQYLKEAITEKLLNNK